ncbi:MAG TPA: PilZ domain-containing protein [Thermoanaerobaculia bacterium]|jgi:hypothetical protein|nr:PilZ domain-containing protein [Thermoanaerobaculia bacterium]
MDERTERRSQPRRQVADVGGLLRVKTEAEVLNLSLTGAAVATTSRLAMGELYRVILRQGPRRIEVGATVARSTLRVSRAAAAHTEVPPPAPPVYEMGLAFLEVLAEPGQEVARFLAEHAEPELGGRLAERFLPPPGTLAEIEREEAFDLRSISPSGLAIETAADLEPGREVALEVRMERPGMGFSVAGRVVYRLPVAPGRFRLGIESVPVASTPALYPHLSARTRPRARSSRRRANDTTTKDQQRPIT